MEITISRTPVQLGGKNPLGFLGYMVEARRDRIVVGSFEEPLYWGYPQGLDLHQLLNMAGHLVVLLEKAPLILPDDGDELIQWAQKTTPLGAACAQAILGLGNREVEEPLARLPQKAAVLAVKAGVGDAHIAHAITAWTASSVAGEDIACAAISVAVALSMK